MSKTTPKKSYAEQVKEIQKELGISYAEARKVHKERKDAPDASVLTKKAEAKAPEAKADAEPKESAKKPEAKEAKKEAPASRPKMRDEEFIMLCNRSSFRKEEMVRKAMEYLGNNAKVHQSVTAPREVYFTVGSVRVPKVGMLPITF